MSNIKFKFKETDNKRWGIYLEDRLLATVGSYEACQSIGQCLSKNISPSDTLKASIAYKQTINRSLVVN